MKGNILLLTLSCIFCLWTCNMLQVTLMWSLNTCNQCY